MTASDIAQQIVTAEKSKNPATKSAATRALNQYVTRRVNEGSSEIRTRAAITGLTNKLRNQVNETRRVAAAR